jgi:hypothetical protein
MRLLDWLAIAGGGLLVLGLTFALIFFLYGFAVCGGYPDLSLNCPAPIDPKVALQVSADKKGSKLITIEVGNAGGRPPIPESAALPPPPADEAASAAN